MKHVNEADNDEITEAGLTVEAAQFVRAPRITECQINLECQLEWHRPLYEDSQWHLMAGRVVHVAMAEKVLTHDPIERMGNMRLMYNIRGTINPVSGEMYGPNSLGLISEVVKAFDEDAKRN
jgi:flavin reductase (DIM6/NTAB) family NADH-FMN oxidoreductase RutF